jgi:hypothetical protein
MNNNRLRNNLIKQFDYDLIKSLKTDLFSKPSPYEIKDNIRFIRGQNKLVSDSFSIIVKDIKKIDDNIQYFKSISNCSHGLNISRKIIKNCLITGISYKNYIFKFNTQ